MKSQKYILFVTTTLELADRLARILVHQPWFEYKSHIEQRSISLQKKKIKRLYRQDGVLPRSDFRYQVTGLVLKENIKINYLNNLLITKFKIQTYRCRARVTIPKRWAMYMMSMRTNKMKCDLVVIHSFVYGKRRCIPSKLNSVSMIMLVIGVTAEFQVTDNDLSNVRSYEKLSSK